jgi:hypothetical protein
VRKTPEQIWRLLVERRNQAHPWQSRAEEVRQTYNGEVAVPLPELDVVERAAVANLLQIGLDGLSKRTASTIPSLYYPPMRPGIKKEITAAYLREDVNRGWWEHNRQNLKVRKRALHLFGYGTSPVCVRPQMMMKERIPSWYVRNPLSSYPGPRLDDDEMVPPDCIFLTKRTRESLLRDYPEQMRTLRMGSASIFDQVEYISDEQITLLVKGADASAYDQNSNGMPFVTLHDMDNYASRPLCVVPGRVTLDRILGKFDGMVGMYHMRAKMNALFMNAIQRGIYPDTWVVAPQGGQAKVITQADGLSGIVGEVEGADIKVLQANPGPYTGQAIDRLTAEERDEGGVPSELSGRSGTNIRTGRRGDAVLAAAIDFDIQEAQEILEESLKEENKIAIAVAKAYGGSKTFSFYVSDAGFVEYNPVRDFPTDVHDVRYSYTGADAEQLSVLSAQKLGAGLISTDTAMEMDPAVKNPRREQDKIMVDQLRKALLASIQQMAQDPASPIPPSAFAELIQGIATDQDTIEDAFMKLHNKMQQAQQAQAQQQAAMQPPGAAQQPGLNATPDQGPIAAPAPSLDHLKGLVRDLAATRAA